MPIAIRIDMRAKTYFDICKRHLRSLDEVLSQLDLYERHIGYNPEDDSSTLVLANDEEAEHYEGLQEYCKEHEISAIVFGAMTVEALINDYGIIKTSKTYFGTYLDKMSINAKWRLIPKIVTGKEIPSDAEALHFLEQLIAARNTLVHSKSSMVKFDDEKVAKRPKYINFRTIAQNTITTVHRLVEELQKIDPSLHRDLKIQ